MQDLQRIFYDEAGRPALGGRGWYRSLGQAVRMPQFRPATAGAGQQQLV